MLENHGFLLDGRYGVLVVVAMIGLCCGCDDTGEGDYDDSGAEVVEVVPIILFAIANYIK